MTVGVCEHLKEVFDYLQAQGYSFREAPAFLGNALTLIFDTTVDVREVKQGVQQLGPCVMSWQMMNPHYPPDQGFRCTVHDHVLVWDLPAPGTVTP